MGDAAAEAVVIRLTLAMVLVFLAVCYQAVRYDACRDNGLSRDYCLMSMR